MNFGPTLKMLRRQRGLRQKDLADFLEVSRPTIAGYETKNKQPDYGKLERLANLFDVSIDYLVTGIDRSLPIPHQTKDEDYLEQLTELINTFDSLQRESKEDLLQYSKLLKLRDKDKRKNARARRQVQQ